MGFQGLPLHIHSNQSSHLIVKSFEWCKNNILHWINWIQCLKKLNRIQIYDKHFLSNFNKNQVYKNIANIKVLINQDKLNTQTNWHIYWIAKLVMATGLLNEKSGLENFPTATIAISNFLKSAPLIYSKTHGFYFSSYCS